MPELHMLGMCVILVYVFLVDDALFNVFFRAQDSLVTLMILLVISPCLSLKEVEDLQLFSTVQF